MGGVMRIGRAEWARGMGECVGDVGVCKKSKGGKDGTSQRVDSGKERKGKEKPSCDQSIDWARQHMHGIDSTFDWIYSDICALRIIFS